MKTFKVNERITVECESKSNKRGFIHIAKLKINGITVQTSSIQWYNRTWESYDYESVLKQLVEKTKVLTEAEKQDFKEFIKNPQRIEDSLKPLKFTAGVMALGNIFGQTKKEKNDWKLRMLKAGLENKGLILPDDFDGLDEDTKEIRLNGAIEALKSE